VGSYHKKKCAAVSLLDRELGAHYGHSYIWSEIHMEFQFHRFRLFILINTIIGIGMIVMNRKYINGLDEMHRKVNMDAMAIALGVGVVGGLSYSMLDVANVIPYDAEIAFLVVLISVSYIIAIAAGYSRYK
jgi:hypothetical protein